MSQANTTIEPHWPPRSPHEALLSSPGRRRRLAQERRVQRTPSPSPIRRSKSTPSRLGQGGISDINGQEEDEDEEDEDEETLQLQLQEIQARLRLKKLQKAKAKGSDTSATAAGAIEVGRGESDVENERKKRRGGDTLSGVKEQRDTNWERRLDHQSGVHVPVSPVKRSQPETTTAPISPGRVRLGIDKGLKGSDVSLGRPPTLKRKTQGQVTNGANDGATYLQRGSGEASQTGGRREPLAEARVSSFSERMANSRVEEAERREIAARIKSRRSDAFEITEQEIEKYKSAATTIPEAQSSSRQTEFSRDQVMQASGGLLQRSKTMPSLNSTAKNVSTSSLTASHDTVVRSTKPVSGNEERKRETVEFESFSSLHLSKRILPHTVLTRALSGKKVFQIPELLKAVVAPAFNLPEIEEDIVVMAIIASKSEPKAHKPKPGQSNEERGKFMVMTLCDLKWEVDLFLFNSGFDKFWKLTVGTVVAILNPGVMPPMKANTNRFSLTINSDSETILEIGTARDLGFCASVKKDGKTCDSWIDKRHTEHCEFHVNEVLKKTKAGRMEVNTMDFGHGGRGKHQYRSQGVENAMERQKENQGVRYNRAAHSTIYMAPGNGQTPANLLDNMEIADSFTRGMSKSDLLARRRAQAEKERDIARKLGEIGGGMGADYMRLQDKPQPVSNNTSRAAQSSALGGTQHGLMGGKSKEIHLSPIKRKRQGTATLSTNAVGWGGNLSKELARMKNGENLQPVRKKTRFITPTGIKEAGRDSFGGEAASKIATTVHDTNDDDDDDLDIIR